MILGKIAPDQPIELQPIWQFCLKRADLTHRSRLGMVGIAEHALT